MRDIRFRAWDKRHRQMLYSCKPEEQGKQEYYPLMIPIGFSHWHEDDLELMQFTGLKDKDGRDIYEGDIIQIGDISFGTFYPFYPPCVVQWRHDRWVFASAQGGVWSFHDNYFDNGNVELVGNIYEHAHLLKAEERP